MNATDFSSVDTYRDQVQQSIDFTGLSHDFFVRAKVRQLLELTSRKVGDAGQLSMLDVGCGIGLAAAHVAPSVAELHGFDLSAESLAMAKERVPSAEFAVGDATNLPVASASVDVAYAMCVMHHVDIRDRPRIVDELGRVIRPGGLAVIFEHNPLNPLTRRAVRNCPLDEGVVLIRRATLTGLILELGFELVESRYVTFFPWDTQVFRSLERGLGWLPLGAQHMVAFRRKTGL